MLNLILLKNLLIIAIASSTITVVFIQKTKRYIPKSYLIPLYSLIVNLVCGYFFCLTFTNDVTLIESIWVGLFSFLGADTIYTTLEGKLAPYGEIVNNTNNDIIGEIPYEYKLYDLSYEVYENNL